MKYNPTQSKNLATYLKYQGPGSPVIDFEVLRAFVRNGADPLVRREGGQNLFEIANYNKWSNSSCRKLEEIVNTWSRRASIPEHLFMEKFSQEYEALSNIIQQLETKKINLLYLNKTMRPQA